MQQFLQISVSDNIRLTPPKIMIKRRSRRGWGEVNNSKNELEVEQNHILAFYKGSSLKCHISYLQKTVSKQDIRQLIFFKFRV